MPTVNMLKKILHKLRKKILSFIFREYGYEIKTFTTKKFGTVEYAQWQHPLETTKQITSSQIQFYQSLVKAGGMAIDIGAHTGDTTVPMAIATGKKGLVLALEPNPYVFKILQRNAQLNLELTNIVPLNFAATQTNGKFEFQYSDASFCNGGFLTEIKTKQHDHHYTLQVQGKNLQQFLFTKYKKELKKLQLIKIDAEGYDKEILKTIPTILKKYKPNLLVECYKGLTEDERYELFDILDQYKYTLFRIEKFAKGAKRKRLTRNDMLKEKHFEILGVSP